MLLLVNDVGAKAILTGVSTNITPVSLAGMVVVMLLSLFTVKGNIGYLPTIETLVAPVNPLPKIVTVVALPGQFPGGLKE